MSAEDAQDDKPSLDPPRLFRRRRKETSEQTPTAPTPDPDPGDTRVIAGAEAPLADAGAAAPVADAGDEAVPTKGFPKFSTRGLARIPRPTLEIPRYVGSAMAGLMTGVVLLCFMWLGFRGCEALRGTESCGPGPGLMALVVVFALTVVVGGLLLAMLKVPDPGMTSFLAVGLASLIATLLLSSLFDSAAILVVLPLLCAATFALSTWIATVQLDQDA